MVRIIDSLHYVHVISPPVSTNLLHQFNCTSVSHTLLERILLSSSIFLFHMKLGTTALMWAAKGGYLETVRKLMESGACVDTTDEVNMWHVGGLKLHASSNGYRMQFVHAVIYSTRVVAQKKMYLKKSNCHFFV